MISIKQIRYALAIEKTLHFRKAAELCHVSQSALSTGLSEFEKHLGLQIFERNNKNVLITPIGKEVLSRVKSIMLQVDDLQGLADSQKSPLSFPLKIGFIPTIAPYLLPRIFPILRQAYPQARLDVVEEQSQHLVDMVRNGEIDTAIIALPYACEGLLTLEFWQEDFYWITSKKALPPNKNEITSSEIKKNELMLLNEGHCLKDHILDVCKFSDVKVVNRLGATNLNTLVQLVRGDLGSTLIPAMAKEQLTENDNSLSAIHLNEPSPHRRIAFVFRPNYSRFSSIEALANLCRESFREIDNNKLNAE